MRLGDIRVEWIVGFFIALWVLSVAGRVVDGFFDWWDRDPAPPIRRKPSPPKPPLTPAQWKDINDWLTAALLAVIGGAIWYASKP